LCDCFFFRSQIYTEITNDQSQIAFDNRTFNNCTQNPTFSKIPNKVIICDVRFSSSQLFTNLPRFERCFSLEWSPLGNNVCAGRMSAAAHLKDERCPIVGTSLQFATVAKLFEQKAAPDAIVDPSAVR
jgi:hypothetical protein